MGEGITTYFKNEFTGWKKFDSSWLAIATVITVVLSVYMGDSTLNIIAALTGIWCVIITGMGKSICFIVGTVAVVLYAYLAFEAKYYGEAMLNMFYYFPMNFIGMYFWIKNTNSETGEVKKRHLSNQKRFYIYGATLMVMVVYGYILEKLGGNLPYFDSLSVVLSVVAQILMVWRLAEQWLFWIAVNLVTVYMWYVDFHTGTGNFALLVMSLLYLVNSFIMYFRWSSEAKNDAL